MRSSEWARVAIQGGIIAFFLIFGFNSLLALRDSEGLKRLQQRNQNIENLISLAR